MIRAPPNFGSLSRIPSILQLPFLKEINFKRAQIKSIPRKTKNSVFFLLIWICGWKSWTLYWGEFSSYQNKNNRCACSRTWRNCSHWRWIGWTFSRCWNARYQRKAFLTLACELSISYTLLSTPSIIKMFTDVTLYSCCDLITLILWRQEEKETTG